MVGFKDLVEQEYSDFLSIFGAIYVKVILFLSWSKLNQIINTCYQVKTFGGFLLIR